MALFILPDAQEDLLALQEYMLDKWSEADWLNAEDEIFDKLELVHTGFLTGAPVQEGRPLWKTAPQDHRRAVTRPPRSRGPAGDDGQDVVKGQ